jgi:hypothetical protein
MEVFPMKKRVLALLLCAAMAFSLLTGCGQKGDSGDVSLSEAMDAAIPDAAKVDVVNYLTDGALNKDSVIMTVNGQEVPASYYLYWLAYYTSQMSSYYTYYGQTFDLTAEVSDGVTMADQLQSMADDATKGYTVIEQKAAENGVELTEDEQTECQEYVDNQEDEAMLYFSTTPADQGTIYTQYQLGSKLRDYLFGEGGENAPTEETLQDYIEENGMYNCRYILCQPEDDTEDEIEKAQEKCQAIYDELSQLEGDELLARFQELQSDNPDGNTDEYSFDSDDSLVSGFREKLAELEVGELGMTDKTSYGYFTLLRLDVDTDTVQDDYVRSAFAAQMNTWGDEAEVVNSGYDKVDVTTFCQNLMALQDIINEAAASEDSSADAS